jgi:hypothetical protein
MTLPTSGPLSLLDIQGEWGGEAPISLGEYYAGGFYVPFGTIGSNSPVASSGPINIASFYGTTTGTVAISNQSISDFQSGTAFAQYTLNANGRVYSETASGTTELEQWCFPTQQAGGFDVYATLTSGALTSGTLNTWMSLVTTRSWRVETLFSGDSIFGVLTIELRRRNTTTVLDTITVDLDATEF